MHNCRSKSVAAIQYSCLLTLLLILLLGCGKGGDGSSGTTPVVNTFVNPVMNGSDPWIIQHGGMYYYTHTLGNRVVLWKQPTVANMASATSAEVLRPLPAQAYSANIWAPELHRANNKWYLYFTAGSGPDQTQRTWVLENDAPDPLSNTWTMKGRLFTADTDFWAIDGTLLEYNSGLFFLWSGRPDASKQDQWLYIARMKDPFTLEGNAVVLSKPELGWERIGGPVNEAPQVLKNKAGDVFLVYSASGCWTDDYALGMLSLKRGGNPMVAADWDKSAQPVFTKNTGGNAFGPGHNAFFKSANGLEDWIIYHANNQSGEGCGDKRNVRMQPFGWSAAGVPQFGNPVRTGLPIPNPGGE